MKWLLLLVSIAKADAVNPFFNPNVPKVLASYTSIGISTTSKLTCDIFVNGSVKLLRVRPSMPIETLVNRVKWTPQVTPSNVLSLLAAAKEENVSVNYSRRTSDIRGDVVTYSSDNGGVGSRVLMQTQDDNLLLKNQSNAAAMLIHFIDMNCGYGSWRTDNSGAIIH